MPFLRTLPDGSVILSLHVQPRSSKNQVAGEHNGALKLRLTAPPVEGKANKAVISFLAKRLNLPKSAITIKSGHHSREKQVLITSSDEERIRKRLTES